MGNERRLGLRSRRVRRQLRLRGMRRQLRPGRRGDGLLHFGGHVEIIHARLEPVGIALGVGIGPQPGEILPGLRLIGGEVFDVFAGQDGLHRGKQGGEFRGGHHFIALLERVRSEPVEQHLAGAGHPFGVQLPILQKRRHGANGSGGEQGAGHPNEPGGFHVTTADDSPARAKMHSQCGARPARRRPESRRLR